MKRPTPEVMARMKEELYLGLAQGDMGIRQATRRMRQILGMSQKEYAQKVANISPRILSEFENGSGNPTLRLFAQVPASASTIFFVGTARQNIGWVPGIHLARIRRLARGQHDAHRQRQR